MPLGLEVPVGDERSTAKIFSKVYEHGQQRVAVTCSRCQAQATQGASMGIPANRAAKNFRAKGWLIDRKCHEAVCPRCQEQDVAMKQTPEAIRAQHKLFSLLEDHFDAEKKRYRPEWDDERISKECGLSVTQVVVTRESLHGPLVDPAVAKAEADLERLQGKIDALESLVKSELGALRTELAKVRGTLQGHRG